MAAIPVSPAGLTGGSVTMQAASSGGDTLSNDGRTLLVITNGGTSAITVTVKATEPCNQGYTHDAVANVAAGATVNMGPFAPARFNNAQGQASVSYSATTSVTVGATQV